MSSIYGNLFRISTYGESHGKAVGVVVDGCPAGLALTEAEVQAELDRRRPGQSKLTTPRNETDTVEIGSAGVGNSNRVLAPSLCSLGARLTSKRIVPVCSAFQTT